MPTAKKRAETQLFPQFSRFIAADALRAATSHVFGLFEKIVLPGVLAIIALHSIATLRQASPTLKQEILTNPYDITPQVTLAETYYQNSEAGKLSSQLALVEWLTVFHTTYADVLGTPTQSYDQLEELRAALSVRGETIDFWESFAAKHPEYRDAHVTLTVLYLQEEMQEKARKSWDAAASIDPNNEVVLQLGELLE